MQSTPEQAEVIKNVGTNKLVCALPGSGKTHTTVSLADEITKSPDTMVLMVTFTNAAVEEMRHRITRRLPPDQAGRVEVKTFSKIMIEQFRQLDRKRNIILGAQLTNYYHRIARKQRISLEDIEEYEQAVELIGRCIEPVDIAPHYQAFYDELQRVLKTYNRIDLNTVVKEVLVGLKAGRLSPLPHTHFIVDEFQDTDPMQLEWLLAHKQEGKVFVVVGDDDQAIYGWRGAQGYENMVRFQAEFEADGYLLSRCFRCSPNILGLAQTLIENNVFRIDKDMASMKDTPGKVTCLMTPSGYVSPFTEKLEQASELVSVQPMPSFMSKAPVETYRHIVDYIESDYKDLAILCRTNKHLDGIEYCLSERGIGVVRLGGRSIFENPHAVGITNLLIGFVFPKQKQMLVEGLAWLGVEDTVLEHINAMPASEGLLKSSADRSSSEILIALSSLRDRCLNAKPDAKEIIAQFQELIDSHFKRNKDGIYIYRMASIKTIFGILSKRTGSFGERVKRLQGTMMSVDKKASYRREDKVILCTMTGSKGLEFKRVLLAMLNRQVIPSPSDGDNPEHEEEERRLLYVAMTRAEEELTLHFNENNHSKFMKELSQIE